METLQLQVLLLNNNKIKRLTNPTVSPGGALKEVNISNNELESIFEELDHLASVRVKRYAVQKIICKVHFVRGSHHYLLGLCI